MSFNNALVGSSDRPMDLKMKNSPAAAAADNDDDDDDDPAPNIATAAIRKRINEKVQATNNICESN